MTSLYHKPVSLDKSWFRLNELSVWIEHIYHVMGWIFHASFSYVWTKLINSALYILLAKRPRQNNNYELVLTYTIIQHEHNYDIILKILCLHEYAHSQTIKMIVRHTSLPTVWISKTHLAYQWIIFTRSNTSNKLIYV